jgi:hypothetical protein
MKICVVINAALCLLSAVAILGSAPTALAQLEPGQVHEPSKYLYLGNESIKPGMEDAVIQNESSQVQSLREANSPISYLGMINITGAPRAIFFAGFDSFSDMQKEHEQNMSNSTLQNALKAENAAEAPMLAGLMGSVYEYRKDLSLNAPVDLSTIRFFDITLFHIRSGHYQDWERLVKLYEKAFSSVSDARWATFEKDYGEGSDNTFIVVTPLTSLAGVDQEMLDGKNLPKTAGADQLQMMRELGSATIESSEADLFAVVPQMSCVPDSWVKASPDFWGKK